MAISTMIKRNHALLFVLFASAMLLHPMQVHAQSQSEQQRAFDDSYHAYLESLRPPCPAGTKDFGMAGCLRVKGQQDNSVRAINTNYTTIAMHQDASDVWIASSIGSGDLERDDVLRQCKAAMGDGCFVVQKYGLIGVARGANGTVFWATGSNNKAVQRALEDECKIFELGCSPLGIFDSKSAFREVKSHIDEGYILSPKDMPNIRRRYAAVSSIPRASGTMKSWIASGYANPIEAFDVALNLCKLINGEVANCQIANATGNGVIAAYKTGDQNQAFLVEQTEERARQAIAQKCKHEQLTCTIYYIYDARNSGAFENVIP
jgi:hypothetical protein